MVLSIIRAPFLLLTPVVVFLAISIAIWEGHIIHMDRLVLALAAAISAHISVNAFNEYLDFKSGLDSKTTRTPFSGGSGTLVSRPEAAPTALLIAITTLFLTAVIGTWLIIKTSLLLLPLGLLGILIVVSYTPWITRNPLASLLAPGIAFGPIMVTGTYLVITRELNSTILLVSLLPFFLCNNLLLLNQFPDVEADRNTGRCNYPILIGKPRSTWLYGILHLCAFTTIVVLYGFRILPVTVLLGLLTLPLAYISWKQAKKYAEDTDKLIPAMGFNVLVTLVTPLLVSAGILLSLF